MSQFFLSSSSSSCSCSSSFGCFCSSAEECGDETVDLSTEQYDDAEEADDVSLRMGDEFIDSSAAPLLL